MVAEDDDGGPVRELLEPPAETVNKLRSDALSLGVDDVAAHDDHVRTEFIKLLEEVLKYRRVLIMTLHATPVDIRDVRDLDQRMLPLFAILERLIIP